MGNCFGSQLPHDHNPSSFTPSGSTRHSSRGAASYFSNGSSSAVLSPFPAALSDETSLSGEILPTPNLKIYSFSDLRNATKNFKPDMVLGVGGFGTVYKGWVDEKTLLPSKLGTGMMVAIKKLNSQSMQGFEEWQTSHSHEFTIRVAEILDNLDFRHNVALKIEGEKVVSIFHNFLQLGAGEAIIFQSEVNFLGRLLHPNLVRLLGYCWEDRELLLVYEFMQKGSLENHLFRRNPAFEPLSWDLRLKIAIGAAKGLTFLHTSDKKVIYRDFKASNILLDGSYNAKISDFGLAKLGPSGGDSHVTTRVMGTYGYAAPEYVSTGHLYVKSDVYGFGVVLLEMLTGLRALDSRRPAPQQNLVDWAKPFLSNKRKLNSIMDARIEGQYSSKAASEAALLALRCLETEPRKRPSMEEVVQCLERIAALEQPAQSSRRSSRSSSQNHADSPRSLVSPRHPSNHSRGSGAGR